MRRTILGIFILAALLAALPATVFAGTVSPQIIGMFPKDVSEFAYADLKTARQQKWFNQVKDQIIPPRFRQFEQFLTSAGVDPNTQVEELTWAITNQIPSAGEQLVGVALGAFNPESLEAYFKAQKLPTAQVRGYTLFAFGSGTGPGDIFFFFIDRSTAAFGHRAFLEKMIDVRLGQGESLFANEKLFPLIGEVNGRGTVWAVLDAAYTRLAVQQLFPQVNSLPQAGDILKRIRALTISIEATRGADARFQAVCASPEDANLFAAAVQAGITYQSYQEKTKNPELAAVLDSVRVTPSGDRLDVRFAANEEMIVSLLRRNTFAISR